RGGLWGMKRPGLWRCRTAATAKVCWRGIWAKA
ncbi:conjugative transfer relaxase TraI, partial [Klebsiella pneumoniae]